MNANQLIFNAEERARTYYRSPLKELAPWQLHEVLGEALMEQIAPNWQRCEQNRCQGKQAFYLSMEYLLGRMIFNNLYCAGVLDEVNAMLSERGIDLRALEDIEDHAFGNGGLGRLAACYLDSAAAHDIPLTGYGLRYRFGLLKQSFVDGRQVEEPDDWSRLGDPFSVRRYDLRVTVRFGDQEVLAVPYDMPVIGHQMNSIGTLRLWQCESPQEVDFTLFNQQQYEQASAMKNRAEDLTKFLYPNDSGTEGKLMRIKQEYLLCSATVQDILRGCVALHGQDYDAIPNYYAIQLNDTHPVMAIPELIRLLELDGVDFERAFDIARRTFSYTNHTVMSEALERWDAALLRQAVPHLYPIIRRINQRLLKELGRKDLSFIRGGRVHMSDLAIYASSRINGVAEIHSQILRDSLFHEWYKLYPERFTNVTNGITQRRWLALCNPQLTSLITDTLGTDDFIKHLGELEAGNKRIDNNLCERFIQIKQEKKRELSDLILQREGILIPEHFVFDVQVKRLHEYKRQLMNAFSIMAIYQGLKDGSIKHFPPTAFIFGAKAAPGYDRAKAIIYYINQMAALINADPDMIDLLRVVFVHNYNCSYAERIIPAADISEQISPAGTEASGTGNMKFMLNGAVTLGTYDGANIEIVREAGQENNYIFGATVEGIRELGKGYDPVARYKKHAVMRRAVDTLIDGTFEDEDGGLKGLHDSLLKGASWHTPDHQYIFLDFPFYLETKLRAIRDHQNQMMFARKCLHNVFSAGKFSSDRSVKDYAADIWGLD